MLVAPVEQTQFADTFLSEVGSMGYIKLGSLTILKNVSFKTPSTASTKRPFKKVISKRLYRRLYLSDKANTYAVGSYFFVRRNSTKLEVF